MTDDNQTVFVSVALMLSNLILILTIFIDTKVCLIQWMWGFQLSSSHTYTQATRHPLLNVTTINHPTDETTA